MIVQKSGHVAGFPLEQVEMILENLEFKVISVISIEAIDQETIADRYFGLLDQVPECLLKLFQAPGAPRATLLKPRQLDMGERPGRISCTRLRF